MRKIPIVSTESSELEEMDSKHARKIPIVSTESSELEDITIIGNVDTNESEDFSESGYQDCDTLVKTVDPNSPVILKPSK